jgi:hypothetical protein
LEISAEKFLFSYLFDKMLAQQNEGHHKVNTSQKRKLSQHIPASKRKNKAICIIKTTISIQELQSRQPLRQENMYTYNHIESN